MDQISFTLDVRRRVPQGANDTAFLGSSISDSKAPAGSLWEFRQEIALPTGQLPKPRSYAVAFAIVDAERSRSVAPACRAPTNNVTATIFISQPLYTRTLALDSHTR